MDPLVTTFSKKTSIRQVNSNRDSTFLWGPYFSYRATWGLFRRDFVDPRGLPVQIPGLKQLVTQPTRGQYLLDLVMCNITDVTTKVCAQISDHACLLIEREFMAGIHKIPSKQAPGGSI